MLYKEIDNPKLTGLSLPHIPENLYVTGNLLLRSFNTMLLKVIDEKLVPPSAPTTRLGISCVWRVPVFLEALNENLFDGFRPDLSAAAILEKFAMLALWCNTMRIVLQLRGGGGDGGLADMRRHCAEETK